MQPFRKNILKIILSVLLGIEKIILDDVYYPMRYLTSIAMSGSKVSHTIN